MADVEELQRQLLELRAAGQIRDDALRYLGKTEDLQRERWALLRRVIEDAGKQYAAMRTDVVEEGQRDQGPPLWLSCILTVGVTLIPVSAMTGSFLLALTTSAQKLLTRDQRSKRALLEAVERFLERSGSGREYTTAQRLFLANQIKRTDETVAKFAKNLETELTNKLQDGAGEIAKILGKQLYRQDPARKMVQTDAPIVVVTQTMHEWVDSLVLAERAERHEREDQVQDLFDIATSPSPEEEAKATEAIAKMRGREYEKPLPKTNKAALDQLTKLRDQLVPAPVEKPVTVKIKELRPLQLIIESMIWATTYDFTPRFKPIRPSFVEGDIGTRERAATIAGLGGRVMGPAALPDGLWKRLIERYTDPDEGKSYKDVGSLNRLGTRTHPIYESPHKFSPEVRLSHYFSQILFPMLDKENSEMVDRFRQLPKAAP